MCESAFSGHATKFLRAWLRLSIPSSCFDFSQKASNGLQRAQRYARTHSVSREDEDAAVLAHTPERDRMKTGRRVDPTRRGGAVLAV